ncbi:TIGR02588 family protein [Calothrix sp. HK-06]|nr:TIGR02588 family protein [Calothrix sp. HK-06]
MNQAQQEFNNTNEQPKRTIAEWITFGAATCILSGIVGLVIYTGLTDKQQVPILSVQTKEAIRQANGKYQVPFEITNDGDKTAESVQILAELKVNNEVEQTGEQQIDFLSSKEKEEGAFIFDTDPNKGELKIRVASYKLP